MKFTEDDLLGEIVFKASRSGGKGGQNVNKVSSRIEVKFNVPESLLLTTEDKVLLLNRLSHRLSSDHTIRVVSQEDRSQLANKQTALKKLYQILIEALHQDKPRKASKPKRAAIEKRLKEKQLKAMKKITRRRDFY